MDVKNTTKYLKFASVQMAVESLFTPDAIQQHQGSESNCFARCPHE